MPKSRTSQHWDLEGYLQAENPDLLEAAQALNVTRRLGHPAGVTLLCPSAADAKKLLDSIEKAKTDQELCSLRVALLAHIIPQSVPPALWEQLSGASYVNAARKSVKVESTKSGGSIVKLEGGITVKLDENAKFYSCDAEGKAKESGYFVYKLEKGTAPMGSASDKSMQEAVREAQSKPVSGGSEGSAGRVLFNMLHESYLTNDGDIFLKAHGAACQVLMDRQDSTEFKMLMALGDATHPEGAMYTLLLPDNQRAPLQTAAVDILNLMRSGDLEPESYKRFQTRQGNYMFGSKANHEKYVAAVKAKCERLRRLTSSKAKLEEVAAAYIELQNDGTIDGMQFLTPEGKAALQAVRDYSMSLLQFGNEVRDDMIAIKQGNDFRSPIARILVSHDVSSQQKLASALWIKEGSADVTIAGETFEDLLDEFLDRHSLLHLSGLPGASGGASAAHMAARLQTWAAMGGGDLDALKSLI